MGNSWAILATDYPGDHVALAEHHRPQRARSLHRRLAGGRSPLSPNTSASAARPQVHQRAPRAPMASSTAAAPRARPTTQPRRRRTPPSRPTRSGSAPPPRDFNPGLTIQDARSRYLLACQALLRPAFHHVPSSRHLPRVWIAIRSDNNLGGLTQLAAVRARHPRIQPAARGPRGGSGPPRPANAGAYRSVQPPAAARPWARRPRRTTTSPYPRRSQPGLRRDRPPCP